MWSRTNDYLNCGIVMSDHYDKFVNLLVVLDYY